jgi:signal peptidase II
MKALKRIFYLLIGVGIFAGDLIIKEKVEKWPKEREEVAVHTMGDALQLVRFRNRKGSFNFGKNHEKVVYILAICFTVLVTLMWILSMGLVGHNMLKLGLTFLLGGAYSNTYDRVRRGYVVDYAKWNPKAGIFGRYIWNIADFFILIGSLLTFGGLLQLDHE